MIQFSYPVIAFTSLLKTCQIVAGISIACQFHEILGLIFGGFLTFGPTMWRQRRQQPRSIHPLDSLPQKRSSIIHCLMR